MIRKNSLRRPSFDYRSGGVYFVTICTHARKSILSRVVNGVCQPTPIGIIALECWVELPYHYARLQLGPMVLMPNHVHATLSLSDALRAGLRPTPTEAISYWRESLSGVVRAFKAFSARKINGAQRSYGLPVWQRGFHDRVVRNPAELREIHKYMAENPARWQFDEENPDRQAERNMSVSRDRTQVL